MARRAAAAAGGKAATKPTKASTAPPSPPPPTPPSAAASPRLQRFRENLAVASYIYFIPFFMLLNLLMVLAHPYTRYAWIIWVISINFLPGPLRASKLGRWPKPLRHALWLWSPLASYFPAKLHKTADLDPQHRYLFVAAPHGIVTQWVWVAFDTDALGFSRLFPKIDPIPLTLELNFKLPLMREFLLLHGIGDASMAACLSLLGRGPGSAILLAAGGAEEATVARPGTMDLILAKRKGFVKVALRTGARLVPVIGFGENELYGDAEEEKRLEKEAEREEEAKEARARGGKKRRSVLPSRAKVSRALKRCFGFVLPEIRGVGPLGLMPRRSPLDVVVGAPVVFDERRAVVAARERRKREAERRKVAAAVEAASTSSAGGGGGGGGKAAPMKREEPPPEQDDEYSFDDMVEGYHAQYVEALKALYDAHKDAHLPGRKRDLEIVK
jgi:2-acylglycerol O-acyltransferase 2